MTNDGQPSSLCFRTVRNHSPQTAVATDDKIVSGVSKTWNLFRTRTPTAQNGSASMIPSSNDLDGRVNARFSKIPTRKVVIRIAWAIFAVSLARSEGRGAAPIHHMAVECSATKTTSTPAAKMGAAAFGEM